MSGCLALVGGGEWEPGCDFDAELLSESGADEVVVLPTGAAYEHPERDVERATRWFERLGTRVRPLMVLARQDAFDGSHASAVRSARFLYLTGGSPMHARAVLKDSPVWEALAAAWHDGAVVAGSDAGARVLCDPMVDPRGGAFTLGLGLLERVAVVPHHEAWSEERARRTIAIAPPDVHVVGVDARTAVVRGPDARWRTVGAGAAVVFRAGEELGVDALP